jgi:two-component sensor histidine kinase
VQGLPARMNLHVNKAVTASMAPDFLARGGEMGAAMRDFDWASTSLGPPQAWPGTLKTCLRIMLASRQPMWVWWGPELINFYNDAYLPIIGGKHPHALGRPARQVWAEIWDQISERIAAAMQGEASYAEAELLVMQRNGYPEESYYTFSFSPVPEEDGSIGGIVCANTDDTDRVIGARRLALLREIASRTWDANTVTEVYALSAEALAADPRDMPFAMLYRLDDDGAGATLCGQCGIAPGHPAAPESLALDSGASWPVSNVVRSGTRRMVTRLGEKFAPLPKGPWNDAPQDALVLPLAASAEAAPRGVLILAANPYRRREDDGFETFATLVARQIAAAVVNIETYEAERERAKSADSLALEMEHRRRIERHQNLLLDELNHRVKNTLATVQAMAIQTLKGVTLQARDTFLARLFALSSQHDLLTLDNWEGASLEGVVRRALRPWREEGQVRFKVEGPAVHLDTKRALALGMAFHELATNAAKYGAFSNQTGMVHVTWIIEPDGARLKLRWEETGGPLVSQPQKHGFGLRLLERGLTREISGKVTLDFRPEGLMSEWDMKLL